MKNSSSSDGKPGPGAVSQRRDERDSLFVLARIRHESEAGEGGTVRVRNVSSGGLMAEAPSDFRSGARVVVSLDGIGEIAGMVAWAEAGRVGIAFDHPIDKTRARKPQQAGKKDELFRPVPTGSRRPGLKPR